MHAQHLRLSMLLYGSRSNGIDQGSVVVVVVKVAEVAVVAKVASNEW